MNGPRNAPKNVHGPSLRVRLVAGGAAAIALALAVAGFAIALLFDRHVTRVQAEEIETHLRQLAGGIDIGADGRLTISRPPADPRFGDPLSGLYWQVGDAEGDVLRSRSLWDFSLALTPDTPRSGELHQHFTAGPEGRPLLVAERTIELSDGAAGRPVRIAVAADRTRIERARESFAAELMIALGLLAAVLALAAWVQIGLGLSPLAQLRRAVASIRAGDAARLPEAVPAEVRPLADEVNDLLAERERQLARARDRAADLAHGLKTPLAALAADARRLRAKGEAEVAVGIDAVVETMRRHVDRELARARAGGAARDRAAARTEVAALVAGLIATLARTGDGERVRFENQVPETLALPFERADLAEVLGNLLENAARYAHGWVRVTAGAAPSTIVVEDDGPGIALDARGETMRRGGRLDQSGGAGLGLAIVRDVLEAYGWRLELGTSSDLGGLRAELRPPEDR
ncbi:MAG: sensor histidine kinase [Rhodospirillales bacterium]|nr:sensor histidine kinase [Rhodospirillales bacterium]